MKFKTKKFHSAQLLASAFLVVGMTACVKEYYLVQYPATYHSGMPYTSFILMQTETNEPNNSTLQAISQELEHNFQTLGLKKDTIKPELLFILRWETHLVGRYTQPLNKETMPTYSVTNPFYSPFENTSDKLKSNPSGTKIRYYDEETFYRIQAIDPTAKELIWSVKIYLRKKTDSQTLNVPQIAQDLTKAFVKAQYNHPKKKNDENNYHESVR